MSVIEEIKKQSRQVEHRRESLCATLAIFSMDPNARADLAEYMSSLSDAEAAEDEEAQRYISVAMEELFAHECDHRDGGLSAWKADAATTSAGRDADERLADETARFFDAYERAKGESGLHTVREIAIAAGLSPTTVQAVQSQRVKPQTKTIEKLARAFGKDLAFFGCSRVPER